MKLELPVFDEFPHFPLEYGGKSCRKELLSFDGAKWMIKFHGSNSNLKRKRHDKNMPKYTNSVIFEWLGSHVYEAIGIPVHETRLGYLDNRLVVACRHLYEPGDNLQELRGMIKSLNDELFEFFSSGGTLANINGLSSLLKEVNHFSTLNLHDYFWDMFIVDAFIGNTDRNLGNIGLIMNQNLEFRKAPVYDNGSSFNCRLPETKINALFNDWQMTKKSIILNSDCPYEDNDKPISTLKYIYTNPSESCVSALERITPLIDLGKCSQPVLDLKDSGLISSKQAAFYISSMTVKYKKRILPAYEKHFGRLSKNINESFHP